MKGNSRERGERGMPTARRGRENPNLFLLCSVFYFKTNHHSLLLFLLLLLHLLLSFLSSASGFTHILTKENTHTHKSHENRVAGAEVVTVLFSTEPEKVGLCMCAFEGGGCGNDRCRKTVSTCFCVCLIVLWV